MPWPQSTRQPAFSVIPPVAIMEFGAKHLVHVMQRGARQVSIIATRTRAHTRGSLRIMEFRAKNLCMKTIAIAGTFAGLRQALSRFDA